MEFLLLTKSTTPIIGQVAQVLGILMDIIFRATSAIGITNIGISIIIFTILINVALIPMTIKQQRSTRLMSVMQPEIQAIQKKYKGKTDNDSMMRQNAEIKGVHEKYGTSMAGGCIQLALQMPILFGLYQVINNIPAYVSSVYNVFARVAVPLTAQPDYINKISALAEAARLPVDRFDYTSVDRVIDFLYKLSPSGWSELASIFPDLTGILYGNGTDGVLAAVERMNLFLGINLASAPWQGTLIPNIAWLIPVFSGLTQWYSTKLMTAKQSMSASGDEGSVAQQMKMMNNVMPLMSVWFCFTLPAGVGLYWIASALCRIASQLVIDRHLDKIDIDKLVEENLKKANEKRAKKGLPPQSISKNAILNAKNMEEKAAREEAALEEKKEKTARLVKDSTEYYNNNTKPGSIASKANMVARYNERQKSGK